MLYTIKRSAGAVTRNKEWLLLAMVPVAVTIAVLALRADRFVVSQDMVVHHKAPVAVTANPVGTIPLNELTAMREEFFQDRFALAGLRDQATGGLVGGDDVVSTLSLRRLVSRAMSLTLTGDAPGVRISYAGADLEQGRQLVVFYMQRLRERLQQGAERVERQGQGLVQGRFLAQPLQIEEQRSLWRIERLGPVLTVLFLSLAVVCAWLIVREWIDPAFKSERQAARYLELPVLGSLPDMDVLSRSLKG